MSASVMTSGLFPMSFPVSSALMRSTQEAQEQCPVMSRAYLQCKERKEAKERETSVSVGLQEALFYRLARDLFWIGTSVVSLFKWRLGDLVLLSHFFYPDCTLANWDARRPGHMSPYLRVERCMTSMQTGSQMVKLRGGSKGLVRFFYLDEHKSCIRWRPSRKNEKAKISIDSIREVCEGKQSEIFQRYSEGSFDPNCCFSLYYGERLESLDLVSSSGEEARTWITGLKYLVAGISDEDSLAKRQRTRDQYPYLFRHVSTRANVLSHLNRSPVATWLKQTFTEADKNGDGSLSISEVLQLLHKLNVNLPRQKVKQMFKEADTDDHQGTLDFEEFCSFYKMMSTRRDLYLLMLTYSNHKDHLDTTDLARFLELEQKMTKVTKDHCLEIVNKFEPCPENQKQGVLGIDGFTSYMRSPAGDVFNPEHYEVTQDMSQPLCNYFISSSHNTYLMGDQLMSQSRVDMYAWVLQAGCRCVEVDCWDGQDGEPIVHHGYTLTSKILFRDVIETINKYAFVKNDYPVILSIENHCSVPQQKKMAQCLVEVMGEKLDLSAVRVDEHGHLPSPDILKGKILVKGKKLPPNMDEGTEEDEGDVTDEDSADEMEDDCKLMNGDTSMTRKQVENVAKKKLDNLMKESKIRDREDPDSFTIAALPSSENPTDKSPAKVKGDDGTDTGDEANPSSNKRTGRYFMGNFSKRKKKVAKLKKTNSLEDTDTDQDSSSSASRAPLHHSRKKKTMKLSRALSDLVKYTKSVGVSDIETQSASSSWQVSSLSETKAHQIMQQKAAAFIHFNQRQLSRIYPSSYRVDSSNFNPQPFWNAGCHLVALNYQSEGRVLQLNRAKFNSNGNCGYILKPACMCEGPFNPVTEDPLPGQMKKQLVLKIISGQQLPKPKDSMLGDRGEIIDPFVEVEVIGLPVDCCKEQTRVVDDNGFNPMWEETLVFTLHMPELALIRFLVWDHDPIGQDFIGQRTIAFTSIMPGYRHVYLEGMEEASIFVHVSVHDITGKGKVASGIKGLFQRNPKQSSLDSHAAAHLNRKHPFGAHLLRRTASAPTAPSKAQTKAKKGLPQIAIDTRDYSSEGAGEDRESSDRDLSASSRPAPIHQRNGDSAAVASSATPPQGTNGHQGSNGAFHPDESKGKGSLPFLTRPMTEPLKRARRLRSQDSLREKPGVFANVAFSGRGRMGLSSNCINCVISSRESPDTERKFKGQEKWGDSPKKGKERLEKTICCPTPSRQVQPEPMSKLQAQTKPRDKALLLLQSKAFIRPFPSLRSRAKARQTLDTWNPEPGIDPSERNARSCSVPRRYFPSYATAPPLTPDCQRRQRCHCAPPLNYGSIRTPGMTINGIDWDSLLLGDSCSSCESLGSFEQTPVVTPVLIPPEVIDNRRRAVGTLQREMDLLFSQKMDELRSKSPMFFADIYTELRPAPPLPLLAAIAEELGDQHLGCFSSSSADHSTPPHTPPPLLPSSGPDANLTLSPAPRGEADTRGEVGPVKGRGDGRRPPVLHRTTSAPVVPIPREDISPPRGGLSSPIEPMPNQTEAQRPLLACVTDGVKLSTELPTELRATLRAESPAVSSPQKLQARRQLFGGSPSRTPVRRSKSEGYARTMHRGQQQSSSPTTVPEVCTDATLNDQLWSRLDPEPGSHRDSVSSSSSISSNDTVIDLSLPNLTRKSLSCLSSTPSPPGTLDPPTWVNRPRSAIASFDTPRVSKSKSNPNLRQDHPEGPGDELQPRPLGAPREPPADSPGRLAQRRHTWSRLYMEGLKQSSSPSKKPSATSALATNPLDPGVSMSKSLGDLTSDDIACNFDSKYRSISRSFVVRPSRGDPRRRPGTPRVPPSDLTEQLRKLTDVEPLTARDFAPQPGQELAGEAEEEAPLRRMSSRSQSRVRYIANRAKQAQERQRLQANISGSPIEERGNPEGACCVARSPCTSLDLLSQLSPPGPPNGHSQTSLNSDNNNELFFMLKL
ncbi:hypothetical protein DPEC_G00015030 [Dallia pectoralis]|uniref:Uncharacterized protein n=1 Tax=Dallia pectoralis TaxID=75939 RepID=A0ACC2HMQ3_DALPE|nr:hypothetical protein DPEC_G00015030 [Dallia pectoralis]